MSQLIFKSGSKEGEDTGSGNITPEDMALLRGIFNNDEKDEDDKKEYKLK